MQLDGEARLGRLVTHWIRRDQRSGPARRIRHATALSRISIDSVRRKQSRARRDLSDRLDKEETVPHDVEAVALRVLNAIEEIVDNSLAVYPVIVVASAHGEPRRRGPIK